MNVKHRIRALSLVAGLTFSLALSGCSRATSQQPGASIPATHKKIAPKLHYDLQLNQIQFAGNAVIVYTTHGTMQTEYVHPQIQAGPPKLFTVLLQSIAPRTYKTNERIPVHNSPVAVAMKLVPVGSNLLLTVFLKPHVQSFETMIGGGDIIQFSFK